MYFRKKLRKADNEIIQDSDYVTDSEGNAIINIKATNQDQIFSEYNYDSYGKLNSDLGEYIVEKAEFIPIKQDIKIRLYTEPAINSVEAKMAIKNNYKKAYVEMKNELYRNTIFSAVMLVVGLLVLAALTFMTDIWKSSYLDKVVEIIGWVFIWEATNTFFLRRSNLKRKKTTLLKLYSADVEVIKLKVLSEKKEEEE